MKTLYLKNYKGYIEQFIPILDVNFLVGENSTGKTTIINLLNIISSPNFWFSGDLSIPDADVGFFDETINIERRKDKYFRIGLDLSELKKNVQNENYALFTFAGKDGIPVLIEYRFVANNKTFIIRKKSSSFEYLVIDFSNEDYKDWVKKDYSSPKFSKFKRKINFFNFPIAIIHNIIFEELKIESKIEILQVIQPFYHLIAFAPIRVKAKRLYDRSNVKFSPEGDHIPESLRQILKNKKSKINNELMESLVIFGKESHLFDGIGIEELGHTKGSPFFVNIHFKNAKIKLSNVGYGVSQILPLLIDILKEKNSWFSIQQPEIHLHPRAQAAFGDFIYNSYVHSKNKFIIETHSDYVIDRFRFEVKKSNQKAKTNSQILFFEKNGVNCSVNQILINKDGSYMENIPKSFRDFFIEEELKLLEI